MIYWLFKSGLAWYEPYHINSFQFYFKSIMYLCCYKHKQTSKSILRLKWSVRSSLWTFLSLADVCQKHCDLTLLEMIKDYRGPPVENLQEEKMTRYCDFIAPFNFLVICWCSNNKPTHFICLRKRYLFVKCWNKMCAHEYETLDKHIITQMICKMIDLKNLWAVNKQ